MAEIYREGCAEQVSLDKIIYKFRYIPYHGVYNSQKRTIRLVRDDSARRLVQLLNEFLPDLDSTNKVVCVGSVNKM